MNMVQHVENEAMNIESTQCENAKLDMNIWDEDFVLTWMIVLACAIQKEECSNEGAYH